MPREIPIESGETRAQNVDGFFGDIPGLINNVKAGKLKPVGLAAKERHPLLLHREVVVEAVVLFDQIFRFEEQLSPFPQQSQNCQICCPCYMY